MKNYQLESEPRNNFYSRDMNMKRVSEFIKVAIEHLSLSEILKMVRDISYDQICYWSKENNGVVYNGFNGDYAEEHIEQASVLQRNLGSACDLFGQSIIGKRQFDREYFDTFNAKYQTYKLGAAQEKIEELEKIIEDIRNNVQ